MRVDVWLVVVATQADLEAMGVSQLAVRRQLMAAVQTQQQYKQLVAKIASLEHENAELREASHADANNRSGAFGCHHHHHLHSRLCVCAHNTESMREPRAKISPSSRVWWWLRRPYQRAL